MSQQFEPIEIQSSFYDSDFDDAFPKIIKKEYEEEFADESDEQEAIKYDY
jgi:hypothetical protein